MAPVLRKRNNKGSATLSTTLSHCERGEQIIVSQEQLPTVVDKEKTKQACKQVKKSLVKAKDPLAKQVASNSVENKTGAAEQKPDAASSQTAKRKTRQDSSREYVSIAMEDPEEEVHVQRISRMVINRAIRHSNGSPCYGASLIGERLCVIRTSMLKVNVLA
ncbi:hypothetical protein FN846DRAFT_886242 [Sphaerosporella brunnea]|uniref:Uncharacterized protein n=1 Tax=Sphaerosporella brunnea TaxID=1250544 RepID=A0A5J5FAU4_9PEZI|nr:hypothetical protein FN846DRAFT_886242 [Sphaerosporella brunnea]